MRFFDLLDFQYVVILIFCGLIALLLLYVAFGGYPLSPGKKERPMEIEEYPGGIQTQKNPVPLILIFIYAGLAIWALVYVILVGIRGGPF